MMKLLGVSCSLRNARYGAGSAHLIKEIKEIPDEEALAQFLEAQTKIRVDDFITAGRGKNNSFDEIYRELRKMRGDRGLSNSEAALVAGLWGAHRAGAEISHTGLSTYFPKNAVPRNLDELRQVVLDADAILVSGPVYFGDRGSLAQEFFEFLHSDSQCAEHVRDRLYAGISVGAKRNGGQETTLIYQIVDATNLNMLAVGNDSKTTSQYGGTCHAGDVGTLHKDEYGIDTAIGTGRRLAVVGNLLEAGAGRKLKDKVRIKIWLLQDSEDGHGARLMGDLAQDVMAHDDEIDISIEDFTTTEIHRCIACDICPTHMGGPEEYRCIINAETDMFRNRHADLVDADAILLGAYSPISRRGARSVYQRFMERTRYLRRDDYAFTNRLVAPLVISQVNANQNLHIRMLTSFVRHHTVLHHPLIGFEHEGVVLNRDVLTAQARSFARNAVRLTAGRLSLGYGTQDVEAYNPVGYVISKEKREEDEARGIGRQTEALRRDIHEKARAQRVADASPSADAQRSRALSR